MPIEAFIPNTAAVNLENIAQEMQEQARACNRKLEDIALMVVSKTQTIDRILPLVEHGHVLFGENRVQEAQEKFSQNKSELSQLDLHLIGSLQKNKLAKAISLFNCIQSIDSIALLQALINAMAHGKQAVASPYPIYLQMRSSSYDYKHGFDTYEGLSEAVSIALSHNCLRLCGIMTIAPFSSDESVVRNAFVVTRNYRDALLQEYGSKTTGLALSMGMSGDYKWAIEEGSNLIRIGSAIFGARN